LEAFDRGRSLDDLDFPRSAMGECVDELFAAVHPVGKDVLELGKAVSQAPQQRDGAVDILNVGGMNVDGEEKTIGVGDDVSLTPIDALARSKPAGPPACVVEALWLSMIAAVGVGLRPSFRLACRTRTLTILSHLPVSRQA